MAKPAVMLIGADKGGVGKTTLSRLLLDYLGSRQLPARAFDTEVPRGTLKRFFPDITDIVDVGQVSDQMRIFDTIHSANVPVTVIDIRAGLLTSTLRALRDIGFIDEAKQERLNFAVFHVLGPSIASLNEIAEIAAYLGDARYIMVKNFINATHFFEWDTPTHDLYFNKVADAVEITVPKLNEMATEQVELASVPFSNFVANQKANGDPANYSFVLRGYVRHWLHTVWAEFDRIAVTDLADAKERAFKPVSRTWPAAPVARTPT